MASPTFGRYARTQEDVRVIEFFVLDDHGAIECFRTLRELESHLEAIDVINLEYEAFNSKGHQLTMRVLDDKRVQVEHAEFDSSKQAVLRDRFSDALIVLGRDEEWVRSAAL